MKNSYGIASLLKDYKFIISVIIGLFSFIGLDYTLKSLNVAMSLIPEINSFISKYTAILLLAIIAIIFDVARKQSSILKKLGMLTPETMIIASDSETMFMGSNAYRHLITKTKAFLVNNINSSWRDADRKFPELRDAAWIADRNTITNDEAIKGGDYTFQREFEINFELVHLRSAELHFLVDDFCELVVNGTRFEKVSGFSECHKFDITKNIIKGINLLQFVIENTSTEGWPIEFQNSNTKYLMNPYGFKYVLSIKYLK